MNDVCSTSTAFVPMRVCIIEQRSAPAHPRCRPTALEEPKQNDADKSMYFYVTFHAAS